MTTTAPAPADANIDIYEKMLDVSGAMLESASKADWDTLVSLEGQCRNMVERLKPNDRTTGLPRPVVERKIDLIKRLLANDAAIRSHVEPWMANVEKYLGDANRQRQLSQAYRV